LRSGHTSNDAMPNITDMLVIAPERFRA